MSRENFIDMVFQGGIPAKDKDGSQCYLYIGIVDMLQEYDIAHKLQYVWKAVKHGPHNLHKVSVQPPGKYKSIEFIVFLDFKDSFRSIWLIYAQQHISTEIDTGRRKNARSGRKRSCEKLAKSSQSCAQERKKYGLANKFIPLYQIF